MPRFDGTGPRGQGPRTGRGLGNCPISKKERKAGDTTMKVKTGRKDLTLVAYKKTVPQGGLQNPGLRKGTGALKADNFKNVRGGLSGANFKNVLPQKGR